ncbi:FtsX-like permease family protein [Nonomuraea salmonea]|uniref:FtsX-like permease family protein n=1 Tax=Nonomuraea salmonea TaxID=46181 RepID=UPI003CD0AEC8
MLNTRERRRDLAMLKSIGMTPRQVTLMMITSMAALGGPSGAWSASRSAWPRTGSSCRPCSTPSGSTRPRSCSTSGRPRPWVRWSWRAWPSPCWARSCPPARRPP